MPAARGRRVALIIEPLERVLITVSSIVILPRSCCSKLFSISDATRSRSASATASASSRLHPQAKTASRAKRRRSSSSSTW